MFEQTTPESNCCLESLQVLYLGPTACLAEWNRNVRKGLPKNDYFCLFIKSWTDVTVVTCLRESGLCFLFSS